MQPQARDWLVYGNAGKLEFESLPRKGEFDLLDLRVQRQVQRGACVANDHLSFAKQALQMAVAAAQSNKVVGGLHSVEPACATFEPLHERYAYRGNEALQWVFSAPADRGVA